MAFDISNIEYYNCAVEYGLTGVVMKKPFASSFIFGLYMYSLFFDMIECHDDDHNFSLQERGESLHQVCAHHDALRYPQSDQYPRRCSKTHRPPPRSSYAQNQKNVEF